MAWMRCIKEFDYPDQRGDVERYTPGKLVDIINKQDLERLTSSGFIAQPTYSHMQTGFNGAPAPKKWVGVRVGFFMFTSVHYSGGRCLMYQYAWCLEQLGAEVYIFTNRLPQWRADYPEPANLHYITRKTEMPPDCDIIITDSKTEYGRYALEYKRANPHCILAGFNFETSNWVAKYVPDYAVILDKDQSRAVFKGCNMYLSCSAEGAKHLLQWLNKPPSDYVAVLQPATNTYAIDNCEQSTVDIPDRPYAVFSARSAAYKKGILVQQAIWELDIPFDLVVFGHLPAKMENTDLHRVHLLGDHRDIDKYKMMKYATVTCAPSLFEGYGMVPGESIAVQTPALVYDLPVLRQEYGDRLIYVPWGNEGAYKRELQRICKAEKKILISAEHKDTYSLENMIKKVQSIRYNCIGKRKVFAHMIAYWGVLQESLESVYPYVDEIMIAYGRDKYAQEINDGSLMRIQSFPDPDNKIKLEVRDNWYDKRDMRQWCTDNSTGNYQILLDGDEVWIGVDKWLELNHPWGCPAWVNFWHGAGHWIYDSATNANRRWGEKLGEFGSTCVHYRSSYWRRSYYWEKHPTPVDYAGNAVNVISKQNQADALPDCYIAHLGHSLPKEVMEAKHKFYRTRDGDDDQRRNRQNVWHNWSGQTGDIGDGRVEAVTWLLPDIVTRAFASLEKIKL